MFVRLTFAFAILASPLAADDSAWMADALTRAGDNAQEIQHALDRAPAEQQPSMRFLIEHMPARDLRSMKADFLLQDVNLAYRTWKASKWNVPETIFLNNVLPYANINESRDAFRKRFHERFSPLVADAKSPGEAAAILNNKIFKELGVKYSRKRRRADQGPFESIDSGLASCTGLSILLIDACRSVGVPARFVGTPLWSDKSGNHSWVEVWDDGWHFTGAAEPTGMQLDKAWFIGRSSKARRDDPKHAIYAVSYKSTPIHFPLVWNRNIDYVHAVNVTDRYANKAKDLPPNYLHAMFKTYGISGDRCCTAFTIKDEQGKVVFSGRTKDESFDGNDHTTVPLPIGEEFRVIFSTGKQQTIQTKPNSSKSQLFAFAVNDAELERKQPNASSLDALESFLNKDKADWDAIPTQTFAKASLSKVEADRATKLLLAHRRRQLMKQRASEMEAKTIQWGEHQMPFHYKVHGDKPAGGRSLFISMHGGGGAPPRVNDQQWNNQKRLYEPSEGVYVAPRAPTNTWNLWHQAHITPMFDRLIENMVLFHEVDPNRVYLLGYSAGGDGVYQLAPRMADRWAAAAMMAGHPNDAKPDNLRNLAFAIYMGGKDGAYNRNQVAAEWGDMLKELRRLHPGQYEHLVTIYPDKGHWMDREDASALPWMKQFQRNSLPKQLTWRKDGQPQERFYWLGTDKDGWKPGERWTATLDDQEITFGEMEASSLVRVYLNDDLLDLDRPIRIHWPSKKQSVSAKRTISTIHTSLSQRFDPTCVFTAVVELGGDENH